MVSMLYGGEMHKTQRHSITEEQHRILCSASRFTKTQYYINGKKDLFANCTSTSSESECMVSRPSSTPGVWTLLKGPAEM